MAAVLVRFVIFAKRVLFWVENYAISWISVLNPIFLPKIIIDMATNHLSCFITVSYRRFNISSTPLK